jgi:myosin heavy subunit
MRNEAGYFVTKARMAELEKTLDGLMDGSIPTGQDPATLIKLNEQLNIVTKRAERAEQLLKATEASLMSSKSDLQTAKSNLAEKQKALAMLEAEKQKERQDLQASIKKLRAEIDQKKKTSATTPEEMEKIVQTYKAAQADLTALNAEKKALQSELRNAKDQVSALEARIAADAATASKLETSKKMVEGHTYSDALKQELTPLEPIPDFDSAVLGKVFDKETLKLVEDAAKAKRDNMREYAYRLSKLANKTDPRSYVGLKDWAWALFKKVSDTPPKERSKYRRALDDTFAAMTQKGSKRLKEIRAEYASLMNPSEEEVKATREEVKTKKAGWWASIKHDFWYFRKTLSVSARFAWTKKKSPFTAIKTFFSELWSFWK